MLNPQIAQKYQQLFESSADDLLNFHRHQFFLQHSTIETPLGSMVALGDKYSLYFLGFEDTKNTERDIIRLKTCLNATIISGRTESLMSIEEEIKAYFKGELAYFKTPLYMAGTSFQKAAWEALLAIPYGETKSYLDQATFMGKSTAYRAVANANGTNRMSIVIPCHRIINHNGKLGGYGGGLSRKKWLLEHEKKYRN